MSKISLATNAVGTAIFTIESPGTSTNRTLTLPDDTGTIVTNSGNQAGSFTTLNTSGAVVFNDAGADVDFRVEGDTDANLLFVDASADKVGIGTNSPATKLDLNIGTSGRFRFTDSSGTLIDHINPAADAFAASYQRAASYGWGVGATLPPTSMVLDSSGNVGIGVTPEAWDTNFKALQIGATAALVYFPSSNQTVLYNNTYYSSGDKRLIDGSATYYSQSSGAHFWGIAGSGLADSAISFTSAMTLDASGNLLVGATTLNGDGLSIKPRGSAGFTTQLNFNRASSATNGFPLVFQNGGVDVGYIAHNNTSTSYVTSSDYRLKENVAPMTGALAKILELNPVTYTWKADGSAGEGFIAHEIQEVAPYAVTGEKDGEEMQGVDYGKITPLLTAALQEAIAEIQSLKARVAELEAK